MKFNKPVTLEEYALSNPSTQDGMKELRTRLNKHAAEFEAVVPGCVQDLEDILAYPVGRYARWKFWHPQVSPARVAIGMGKLEMWRFHLTVMSDLYETRKALASISLERTEEGAPNIA